MSQFWSSEINTVASDLSNTETCHNLSPVPHRASRVLSVADVCGTHWLNHMDLATVLHRSRFVKGCFETVRREFDNNIYSWLKCSWLNRLIWLNWACMKWPLWESSSCSWIISTDGRGLWAVRITWPHVLFCYTHQSGPLAPHILKPPRNLANQGLRRSDDVIWPIRDWVVVMM